MNRKTKKIIYRILWVATGALSSTLIIGLISLVMIYNNIVGDWIVGLYFLLLLFAGILFGLICGRIAWNKVYVEGIRGSKYVKEHAERVHDFESKLFISLKDFDIDKAMKWTVTIFLIFIMFLMCVGIAFLGVAYVKIHTSGLSSALEFLVQNY